MLHQNLRHIPLHLQTKKKGYQSVLTLKFREMKEAISVAPGGFLGFYMFGTMAYMKANYRLEDYYMGGCSAGSAVAAYALSRKKDTDIAVGAILPLFKDVKEKRGMIWPHLIDTLDDCISSLDCDYERAFVSTSALLPCPPWVRKRVFTSFQSEDEFVKRVKMSCFVPILSGGITYDHNFDGMFTEKCPLPKGMELSMYITPTMWGRNWGPGKAVSPTAEGIAGLFFLGYADAIQNRDRIPLRKRNPFSSFYLCSLQVLTLKKIIAHDGWGSLWRVRTTDP